MEPSWRARGLEDGGLDGESRPGMILLTPARPDNSATLTSDNIETDGELISGRHVDRFRK